ncbi:hypothetical protein PT974_05833 [Cladobotryum mycophilum]|uniref:Acetylserotonin methytransferase-like protein n=1 Tax=Cladobotryum mycophilum TaxID=491253 RepID=A0ABR0SJV8_9HYPO
MASQQASGSASFSLFPNSNSSTPRPGQNTRRSESRERRAFSPQLQDRRPSTPHAVASPRPDAGLSSSSSPPPIAISSPPQNGRQTPLEFDPPRRDAAAAAGPAPQDGGQSSTTPDEQQSDVLGVGYSRVRVQQPRLTIEVPGRSETAFSQAQTLVAGNAGYSRSSIAKVPFPDGTYGQPQQPMPSMFPTYNPELPLQQQNYAPAQMSPSRVPRAVISRQSYFEDPESSQDRANVRNPAQTIASRPHNPPVIPKTCTTDQLRDLWKVSNGWKASSLEGRVFCLRLTQQKDAPVYTLSSASQPFYSLRLDPTSASAYVSLSRHDPSKPFKAPKPPSRSPTNSSRNSGNKYWHEALSTTLEEEARKHQPNDGLVALLMPSSATRMAIERAEDAVSVAAAERECARLVWDDDSASHFLVHPALATPFCITIEHSPAWSRVEYTLEHHESPQHLAKLTRDGTGGGWLEIDTSIASKIEAFYIVDVAVTALLLVAATDDRRSPSAATETFEAPPVPEPARQSRSLSSALSRHLDDEDGKKTKKNKKDKKDKKDKKGSRMEQFEIDIESQDGSLGKNKKKADDKLPFIIRVVVKLVKGLFNFFIWLLTLVFGCFRGCSWCFTDAWGQNTNITMTT